MNTINWMSQIDNETPISKLSIPGTHDSCALYDFSLETILDYLNIPCYLRPTLPNISVTNTAKCQNYGLTKQLEMGIRILDIRLKKTNTHQLTAWHGGDFGGGVNQKITFTEIIQKCKQFLVQNPLETIFMFINKEIGNDISSLVSEEINNDFGLWNTENQFPETLKNVRGKIVLLNRYNSQTGVDFSQDWKNDNEYFTISNKDSQFYRIQDKYEPKGDSKQASLKKFEDIQNLIEKSSNNKGNDQFYFNFMSAVYMKEVFPGVSRIPKIEIPDTMTIASIVNPEIKSYLEVNKLVNTGFLLMDFCNETISRAIIETNFNRS